MAVDAEYIDAIRMLGFTYYNEDYGIQDYKKAFEYLSKAAERGDISSQYLLGVMFIHGCGRKKDLKNGIKHLEIASTLGYGNASAFLAYAYMSESAVLDLKKAKKYAILAKEQGSEWDEDINEIIENLSSLRTRVGTFISVKFGNWALYCLYSLLFSAFGYWCAGIKGVVIGLSGSIVGITFEKDITKNLLLIGGFTAYRYCKCGTAVAAVQGFIGMSVMVILFEICGKIWHSVKRRFKIFC